MSNQKNNNHQEMAMAHTIVEFILEDLELLLGHKSASSVSERNQILSLYEDLKLIRSFIQRVQGNSKNQSTVSSLVTYIALVVRILLDATDSYIRRNIIKTEKIFDLDCFQEKLFDLDCFLQHSAKVADLLKKIKVAEKKLVYAYVDGGSSGGGSCSSESSSSLSASSVVKEKIVVGFEDEASELQDRLIAGRKQLEVVSLTGMAGIGKTTLANKLYNDPSIVRHFHIRAWTSVSQLYEKRNLLSNILSSILSDRDPIFGMSDEHMGEKLYRCLKGNKYLIVIDDVWDFGVWHDLEKYFPEDDNCSRILLTSRIEDVVSQIKPENAPYSLRFLTRDESWDLFEKKAFPDAKCTEQLIDIGKQIVAACSGLPLAIVVIAGLLSKEERTVECWTHITENIGSSVNTDLEHFMDILSLSYKHLPSSLKSCFLYFGSFPEDYEFPVKWLIRSWIAEGFIQPIAEKRLEDVAEEYLTNLISRSLVMVAKKSSGGGIKSCHIHDLLRDLCRKKGEEKKFVQLVCNCGSNANPFNSKLVKTKNNFHRSTRFSDCQFFHFYSSHSVSMDLVVNTETLSVYKHLSVLNLRHLILDSFPLEILQHLHLKYLALHLDRIGNLPPSLFNRIGNLPPSLSNRFGNLPPSVFNLWNLQTFMIDGEKGRRVELTFDIIKMKRLRHLQISQELFCQWNWWTFRKWRYTSGIVLDNLQTISQLCPLGSAKMLLSITPNLRKVGFHLTLSESRGTFVLPKLLHLNQLETLKFEYQTLGMVPFSIHGSIDFFPPTLKKLTLIGSHVHWKEMSIIGLLPNLEVLKIKDNFFSGSRWETTENEFCHLRFLKLSHIDLQQWISRSSHFPRLEHLVLNGCLDLEEIPLGFGDILSLQTIKVYRSSESAVESARQVQESQESWGNDDMKVFIYQHFQEY